MNMNVSRTNVIYALCTILVFGFGGTVLGYDDTSEPMLPEGLIMEDTFKPGIGPPVGEIQIVEGEGIVIHADMARGYRAEKGLPIFEGDAIVTLETGRIRFILNDGSILTLGSETKLVINQSIYDPTKRTRSSYLTMGLGKARFWVTKLVDLKRSVFKVKTPTAVCGVRGSDFIGMTTPNRSEITALEETTLEVFSLAFPEEEPLVITDFERAIVEKGARPRKESVIPKEIEKMKEDFEFIIAPSLVEPEEELPEKAKKKPAEESGQMPEAGILVPDEELVMPERLGEPDELRILDIFESQETSQWEEEFQEVEEEIAEEEHEGVVRELEPALAPFPTTPDN